FQRIPDGSRCIACYRQAQQAWNRVNRSADETINYAVVILTRLAFVHQVTGRTNTICQARVE
ncbi:hypothetical protein, partial [Thiolapillus sp.]|uniref:hypothetical protein n=1 Tax=Thiolapillus sp. TaxID=2017437 RepID=UPI003AF9C245